MLIDLKSNTLGSGDGVCEISGSSADIGNCLNPGSINSHDCQTDGTSAGSHCVESGISVGTCVSTGGFGF